MTWQYLFQANCGYLFSPTMWPVLFCGTTVIYASNEPSTSGRSFEPYTMKIGLSIH